MKRNLELSSRKENVREKKIPNVIKFDIDNIYDHFKDNCQDIRSQLEIYDALISENNDSKANVVLKSLIVLIDSSLDFYLHEITKYGLQKIHEGDWDSTEKYGNIILKLSLVERVLKNEEDENWFFRFINDYYAKDTFVSFSSFKDQMNLIGLDINRIADEAFYQQGSSERTIDKLKRRINELYNRRNVVAHQFDRYHEDATPLAIDKNLVNEFLIDIEKIVIATNKVMLEKN